MPRRRTVLTFLVVAAGLGSVTAPAALAQGRESAVVVNGAALAPNVLGALQQRYRTQIPAGRYWYDPVSGVWGRDGGPAEGQIAPGLALGGPLRAEASRGDTGVFVNGRELHRRDVQAVERCTRTRAVPGRYWVAASGIGGHEGGPPTFDLAALCAGRGGGGGSTQTECAGAGCQSTNHLTGIGAITDGQGGAAVFVPGSGMIMTPN